jgi:hypothetical protein
LVSAFSGCAIVGKTCQLPRHDALCLFVLSLFSLLTRKLKTGCPSCVPSQCRFINLTESLQYIRWWSLVQVAYPVLFLSLQILGTSRSSSDLLFPSELALVEALKLICNVYLRYRSEESPFTQTQGRTVLWDGSREFEEHSLQRLADQESEETVVSSGEDIRQEHLHREPTMRSWLTIVYASAVWAGATYIVRVHWIITQLTSD